MFDDTWQNHWGIVLFSHLYGKSMGLSIEMINEFSFESSRNLQNYMKGYNDHFGIFLVLDNKQ